jgi:hypothetical protein
LLALRDEIFGDLMKEWDKDAGDHWRGRARLTLHRHVGKKRGHYRNGIGGTTSVILACPVSGHNVAPPLTKVRQARANYFRWRKR